MIRIVVALAIVLFLVGCTRGQLGQTESPDKGAAAGSAGATAEAVLPGNTARDVTSAHSAQVTTVSWDRFDGRRFKDAKKASYFVNGQFAGDGPRGLRVVLQGLQALPVRARVNLFPNVPPDPTPQSESMGGGPTLGPNRIPFFEDAADATTVDEVIARRRLQVWYFPFGPNTESKGQVLPADRY
jgi:hypothetical protein